MPKLLHSIIIKSQRISLFQKLGEALQNVILQAFIRHLKKFPEIEAIYVTGSMAQGTYVFGASDIDAMVMLKPQSPAQEFEFLLRHDLNRFGRIFPLARIYAFSPRDVQLMRKISRSVFILAPHSCLRVDGQKNSLHLVISPRPAQVSLNLFSMKVLTNNYLTPPPSPVTLRNFYKMTFKMCCTLLRVNLIRQGKDVFSVDLACCEAHVPYPHLREICRKSGSCNTAEFFSKDTDKDMNQTLACLMAWIDEISQAQQTSAPVPQDHLPNRPVALSQVIDAAFVELADQLATHMPQFLKSIIYYHNCLYIVARTASIEEVSGLMATAKKYFREIHRLPPDALMFWTPSSLYYQMACDPFEHKDFLESAHGLFGDLPQQLVPTALTQDYASRKLQVIEIVWAMKKVLKETGPVCLAKQHLLLKHLAVNRLILEKNEIPGREHIKEEYREAFGHESTASEILRYLDLDVDGVPAVQYLSLSRDLYMAQCLLLDQLELCL